MSPHDGRRQQPAKTGTGEGPGRRTGRDLCQPFHGHAAAPRHRRAGWLTRRIGNPPFSGAESGFAAITEPLLDDDYFLMTTDWEQHQPHRYASGLSSNVPRQHEVPVIGNRSLSRVALTEAGAPTTDADQVADTLVDTRRAGRAAAGFEWCATRVLRSCRAQCLGCAPTTLGRLARSAPGRHTSWPESTHPAGGAPSGLPKPYCRDAGPVAGGADGRCGRSSSEWKRVTGGKQ
jgi:hypothetical protein